MDLEATRRLSEGRHVAVVGSGSIGIGWAIVFARAGITVRLTDVDSERLDAAGAEIFGRLRDLAGFGLIDEDPEAVAGRVSACKELSTAVAEAFHVQECAPEKLEVKRTLFTSIDAASAGDATLASSTSAIPASQFASHVRGRDRCLILHPANPPYLLPVVEIVPAPFTKKAIVTRSAELLEAIGMSPVIVRAEIDGFVFNRLQGAVLREAYCLVRDEVASVEDVDRMIRDGLGRRWSVIGPFETADLNVRGGIKAHAERMGAAYARMGAQRGKYEPWTADLVAKVDAERRDLLPLEKWEDRVEWRDRCLMLLERARRTSSELVK